MSDGYRECSLAAATARLASGDGCFDAVLADGPLDCHAVATLLGLLQTTANTVTTVDFANNDPASRTAENDEQTGLMLASYLAGDDALTDLSLSGRQLGEPVYLAFACALAFNSSLKCLSLTGAVPLDAGAQRRCTAAFALALQSNPRRPARSAWSLFANATDWLQPCNDYLVVAALARDSHPTLLAVLLFASELLAFANAAALARHQRSAAKPHKPRCTVH